MRGSGERSWTGLRSGGLTPSRALVLSPATAKAMRYPFRQRAIPAAKSMRRPRRANPASEKNNFRLLSKQSLPLVVKPRLPVNSDSSQFCIPAVLWCQALYASSNEMQGKGDGSGDGDDQGL